MNVIQSDELEHLVRTTFPSKRRFSVETELRLGARTAPPIAFVHGGPDPFLDRHVRQFVGRQIGQLHAGLMDGGQLLLLEHLFGDVVDRDDQV